jgi:hypothetical protein
MFNGFKTREDVMGKTLHSIAFSFLFVSLLAPAAAFAKGPVAISRLPYTITTPGKYTLSQNIIMTTDADGITVTVDNVTIDMAGFGITSVPSPISNNGINLNNRTGVKIMNGFITGFASNGIWCSGSQNTSVTNMDIYSNGYGILTNGGSCATITNCTVHNCNGGISINGYGNKVSGCTVNNISSSSGIYVAHGSVTDNVVYNCLSGINVSDGSVRNNYVTNNTAYGIAINSANCLLEGNVCNGNAPGDDFSIVDGVTKGLNSPATP